jgi:hypothetical protein
MSWRSPIDTARPPCGMRDLQVHEDVDVVLEEARVLPQEFRDLVGV